MKKKVVLGLVTYSSGNGHLFDTLQSILDQSYSEFDLYIFEDPSDQPLDERVIDLINKNKSITYTLGKERIGSASAYEFVYRTCLEKNPEYFAWLTDHDIYHKDWLYSLLQAYDETEEELSVVYSDIVGINHLDQEIDIKKCEYENFQESKISKLKSFGNLMSGTGNIAHGLYNAIILKKFKVKFPICLTSDRVFIFQLLKYGGIKFVNKELFFRRIKEEELSYIIESNVMKRQVEFTFLGRPPIYYNFLDYRIINTAYLFASELKSIFQNKDQVFISLLVPFFYAKSNLKVLKLHFKYFFLKRYKALKQNF